jgi:hypothetical protein
VDGWVVTFKRYPTAQGVTVRNHLRGTAFVWRTDARNGHRLARGSAKSLRMRLTTVERGRVQDQAGFVALEGLTYEKVPFPRILHLSLLACGI